MQLGLVQSLIQAPALPGRATLLDEQLAVGRTSSGVSAVSSLSTTTSRSGTEPKPAGPLTQRSVVSNAKTARSTFTEKTAASGATGEPKRLQTPTLPPIGTPLMDVNCEGQVGGAVCNSSAPSWKVLTAEVRRGCRSIGTRLCTPRVKLGTFM